METCYAELVGWFSKHGGFLNRAIDLFAESTLCGRGVIARTDISAGDDLLRIPLQLSIQACLEAQKRQQAGTELAKFFEEYQQPMSNVLRLTLSLVHELHVQKEASPWWPYLDFLERTVRADLPMLWPQEARAALKGTSVSIQVPEPGSEEPEQAESFEETFAKDVLPVMTAGGETLWPTELRSPMQFLRCLSWVMSRGLKGGLAFALDATCVPALRTGVGVEADGPFMLPLFDQLNHSSSEGDRRTKLRYEDGHFVARAEQPIAAGEEIFISYGNHNSAELLRTYGFVESGCHNPHDRLLVTRAELLKGCAEGQQKNPSDLDQVRIQLLQDRSMLQSLYQIPLNGEIPASLWSVVQVLCFDPKEFEEFKSSDLTVLGKRFHARGTQHASRVAACILLVLGETVKRFGDEPILENDAAGRTARAAAIRKNELAILKTARTKAFLDFAPRDGRPGKRRLAAKPAAKKQQKQAEGDKAEDEPKYKQADAGGQRENFQ
eukprot:TRINITY_DN73439_c0_g1_i1.p1 TRINITY_DN73439_c0_g1~~TRINITY_DN73439_c0_g1_i1.p1  ORF type:complete len:495 (-),score=84.38 TRINITY_DN73439_c0_g1_i1:200-1684(-)